MLDTKKFHRLKEDFTCEMCSAFVEGNGYTNHCPTCFYSKHVDINPGDRASKCSGLMKPLSYRMDGKKGVVLTHECTKCKEHKNNKLAETDSIESLLKAFKCFG